MNQVFRYASIAITVYFFGSAIYNGDPSEAMFVLYGLYWQASYFELSDRFDAFKKIAAETATEAKELINQYQEKNKMVDKLLEDIEIVVKKGDV